MIFERKEVRIVPEAIEQQEILDVAEGMKKYGGSFCEMLGKALIFADSENAKKIKTTWPIYWKRYLTIVRNTGKTSKELVRF